MVATYLERQRLSARDDSGDSRDGRWGTFQIAAPAIVGGVLLLLFAAYIIWQRRSTDKRPYDYHPVRPDWVSNIRRIFVLQRRPRRVLPSHGPVTLDESIRTPRLVFDFNRGSRQGRSDSTDSQTPFNSTGYPFDYPPSKDYVLNRVSGEPLPIHKRRTVRWWWLFGSRPRQIKSEEPNQRWRVDGPDVSSSGHGHSSNGHLFAVALRSLHEDADGEDEVVRIGENADSVASTPMIQHFPPHLRSAREMSTIPEHPPSSGAPARVANVPQSVPGTPVSSANRGLPPSYDVSQSHTRYQSVEDIVPRVRPGLITGFTPPVPVRAAGYPSPRALHGHELSSDSFMAAQPPMIATSMY